MIHISSELYLSEILDEEYGPDNPRIGWHNLVDFGNISADSSQIDYPVTNISNPATNEVWISDITSEQYIYITLTASQNVDYIGIAGHNFGTGIVEYVLENSPDNTTWSEVFTSQVPSTDRSIIHHFVPSTVLYWRLKLTPTSTEPSIAVIYLGEILIMPRRIYVGHTPINYGRQTQKLNGKSVNGHFLGTIIRGTNIETAASFQNIPPDFYRSDIDPFIEHAREYPFFWAWRPSTYPTEVGYAWATKDIKPVNQLANGYMQLDIPMQGVAP